MPRLPATPTLAVALADWLELLALTSANNTASAGDLTAALVAAALFEDASSDALERKVLSVFGELDRRAASAAPAYPFDVQNVGVLKARDDAWTYTTYLFCLALSNFGNRPDGGVYPARAFEVLCRDVAGQFVGGTSVRFGSPRTDVEISREFARAVDQICQLIREGAPKARLTRSTKDDGVDVVAWREFQDIRPGKLLAFGNCASGDDWDTKLNELQPQSWCASWLSEQLASPVLKLFFLPRRVESEIDWTDHSRRAGVIFDRCRISKMLPQLPDVAPHGDVVGWTKARVATWN